MSRSGGSEMQWPHVGPLPKTTKEINAAIRKALAKETRVSFGPLEGQDCLAVGLGRGLSVDLAGFAGDYFASLNHGATINLPGAAGRFAADTMTDGQVTMGAAGVGLGFSLYGGTVLVKGNVAGRVAQMTKGGVIIVLGNVGHLSGLYMLGGKTVIFGDAGQGTGDWMVGGVIFVGGEIASLGNNAQAVEPSDADAKELTSLFESLSLGSAPRRFQKIVPVKLRPFYKPKKKEKEEKEGDAE